MHLIDPWFLDTKGWVGLHGPQPQAGKELYKKSGGEKALGVRHPEDMRRCHFCGCCQDCRGL